MTISIAFVYDSAQSPAAMNLWDRPSEGVKPSLDNTRSHISDCFAHAMRCQLSCAGKRRGLPIASSPLLLLLAAETRPRSVWHISGSDDLASCASSATADVMSRRFMEFRGYAGNCFCALCDSEAKSRPRAYLLLCCCIVHRRKAWPSERGKVVVCLHGSSINMPAISRLETPVDCHYRSMSLGLIFSVYNM